MRLGSVRKKSTETRDMMVLKHRKCLKQNSNHNMPMWDCHTELYQVVPKEYELDHMKKDLHESCHINWSEQKVRILALICMN